MLARKCAISHWVPFGVDIQMDGCTVTLLSKFLRWTDKQILSYGATHMGACMELFYKSVPQEISVIYKTLNS